MIYHLIHALYLTYVILLKIKKFLLKEAFESLETSHCLKIHNRGVYYKHFLYTEGHKSDMSIQLDKDLI